MEDLPLPGTVLSNQMLSARFTVGVMGGMRRSTQRNLLLLISDPFKGLYQDRWEGGVLHYTGMGPSGHQDINYAQNRTLAESKGTKIPVYLVEALEPQKYTVVGQVELAAPPYQEEQPDDQSQPRQVWMFPLRVLRGAIPALSVAQAVNIEAAHSRLAGKMSLAELKVRAELAKKTPARRTAQTTAFVRDAAVAELAKRLAQGVCDLCGKDAPFLRRSNEPYLECHHVVWLAKGGEDRIENTVALCPNCHRRMHVLNSPPDIEKLTVRIAGREHA